MKDADNYTEDEGYKCADCGAEVWHSGTHECYTTGARIMRRAMGLDRPLEIPFEGIDWDHELGRLVRGELPPSRY